MSEAKLKLVLCWHLHQPWCWDPTTARYEMPWTYLHAVRDYIDMAAHLEAVPGARAVFSFTPILLEQLSDYENRIALSLLKSVDVGDPLLDALRAVRLPTEISARETLMRACLRAPESYLGDRFSPYARLADLARRCLNTPAINLYINEQFIADLLMWFHLAWLGETARNDERVRRLMELEGGYTHAQRMEMLTIIGELIAGVIPRYQRLAARGQAELAVTPYAHPIAPLLIDFTAAREAQPNVLLPAAAAYPGGVERARWHVEKATLIFEHVFGHRPVGCWPAEGAVSTPFLALLDEHKFHWTATGRATIGHSLANNGAMSIDASAHRVQGTNITCFHGDDGLSDLIGFTYASWAAEDAVDDLMARLHARHRAQRNLDTAVVAVIAAGDNIWQNYPRNGWEFVQTLYRRLGGDSKLELTTFQGALQHGAGIGALPTLVAGSGSYGNFSGWIGEAENNAVWERLCDAKRVVDEVFSLGTVSDIRRREIEQQLAICESSDWFGTLQSRTDIGVLRQRQRLFHRQILRLYQLLGVRASADVQSAAAVLGSPQSPPI